MPRTVDRPHPARRRAVRLPRPRAGAAATGLFLAGLILSAATVPLVEPTDATTGSGTGGGTAQAALATPAR